VTGTIVSPPDYVAVTTTYGPQNLPLDSVNLGDNTVTITDQRILDAFTNSPLGTTFKASVQSSYANGLSVVESVSDTIFTPEQVTTSLSLAPVVKTFGDAQFSLLPYVTTNSKAALSFTIGDTSIATLSDGNKLNILTAGSTTISVSQAAYGIYTQAVSSTVPLVVNDPYSPTLTFNNANVTGGIFTISSKNVGAGSFTPQYPSSNSAGAYTYTSSDMNVATVDNTGAITIKNAGTTSIVVLQAAAGNYISASVTASFVVNPIAQTFTFNGQNITNDMFTISSKNFGASSFTPTYPTSNSSGALSYTSSDINVATVDATTGAITVVNAGSTTITLSRAAAGNYTAGSVQASLVVNPIDPGFVSFTISSQNFGASSFTPTYPTSNSTGTPSYTSSNTDVATVNNTTGLITVVNAGSTTITVSRAAAGNYTAGSAQASLVVNPVAPTFGVFTISSQNFGASSFTPTYPTSNSAGTPSYTSSNTNVATVNNTTGLITVVNAGSTTITVSRAAAGNYTAGSAQASLVVNPIAPTFTFGGSTITNGRFTVTPQTLGDTSFTPTYPTSNSAGAYTYASSDTGVATVNSTTGAITIKVIGTATITVSQAAAGNYTAGSVQGSLMVMYKWVKQGADIDGEALGDKSGYSVSLSNDGSMVAVGAPNNGGADNGHVRVYKYANGSWTRQGGDINGASDGDQSGYSVSLSNDGSFVAIGAPTNDGNESNSGHVRVYKYVNNAWVKQGSDIEGENNGDNSGISVSLSSNGSIVAIGASKNNNTNGTDAGHVRVYKYVNNAWVKQGLDIDGEAASDEFGTSVSLSADGSIVAIGAPKNNNGNGTDAGHVRVYKYTGGAWVKQGGDINGASNGDNFGTSVSLSADGSIVAVGAPNNNGNGTDSGHVRVYKYSSGAWVKQGADIDGEDNSDNSGTSVSLSADGSIVAIGAPNNNGNGTDSGQVRVYKLIGNTWTKQDGDIDGEDNDDLSGYSVSLSGNGLIVAIGAYENDDNGNDAGQVRVYKYMLSA
jgi:uncharacterized protein YjdB